MKRLLASLLLTPGLALAQSSLTVGAFNALTQGTAEERALAYGFAAGILDLTRDILICPRATLPFPELVQSVVEAPLPVPATAPAARAILSQAASQYPCK